VKKLDKQNNTRILAEKIWKKMPKKQVNMLNLKLD